MSRKVPSTTVIAEKSARPQGFEPVEGTQCQLAENVKGETLYFALETMTKHSTHGCSSFSEL